MSHKVMILCIKKQGLGKLSQTLAYYRENQIDRLVLLLMGAYMLHEEGLRRLLQMITDSQGKHSLSIHLIHEGLAYDMSPREYNRILADYPGYHLEPKLTLCSSPEAELTRKVHCRADDTESWRWNDEGYTKLLQTAQGPDLCICAAEHPKEDEEDIWAEKAWHLSNSPNCLKYLDDGESIEIDIEQDQYV